MERLARLVEPPRREGTLVLHLLGTCNLRCRHCYMDGGPTRRETLPAGAVAAALAEAPVLGIGRVYLTGGEPLLYAGLREVLAAASRVEGLQITVCTNGTQVTPEHARRLAEVDARAHVSVDGDEAFHDRFRAQPGAFRKTQRGIQRLIDAGVPVTVVATISQDNAGSLSRMVAWARSLGAHGFMAQPLLALGRGEDIEGRCLTVPQTHRFLLELSDLANRYRCHGFRCTLVGVTRQLLLAHPCGAYVCNGAGCHRRVEREIKKLVVRENGTILPEATNLSPRFALGRLGEAPLATLVTRYFAGGHREFDRLCRTTYAEVVPTWDSPVVPWDQLIAHRSHTWTKAGGSRSLLVSGELVACSPTMRSTAGVPQGSAG